MKAGQLRQRVQIQSKSTTQDSFGAEVIAWPTLATVWASIEPLSGREFLDAQQMTAVVDTRIRIRYLETVRAEMRVAYGSRIFDIKAVLHTQENRRETVLMCQEVEA